MVKQSEKLKRALWFIKNRTNIEYAGNFAMRDSEEVQEREDALEVIRESIRALESLGA